MTDWIILGLAVLPVILLLVYTNRKDKFEKEPFWMLAKAFLFGCLSTIPALILEGVLQTIYSVISGNSQSTLLFSVYNGYVVAGLSEELCKMLMLALAVWKSRHFNEYFDGIVYAACVSLGFAAVENVLYVFSGDTMSDIIHTGILRAVLSVPAHFLFGVAMGYFFALAKFEPAKRGAHLRKAFFVPLLLHGTFDAIIFIYTLLAEDLPVVSLVLFALFIFFDIRLWKLGVRKMKYLQKRSEIQYWENYTSTEDENI